MIKELWVLVKMLFASRPSDMLDKELELTAMNHFPFRNHTFMAWCGKVIVRTDNLSLARDFFQTEAGTETRTHEKGHIKQAFDEHSDNWIRYYLNYFWNWIKWNPLANPSSACYYCNRYEVQAYAKQDNPEYWKADTRIDLKGKYSIKQAKSIYKQLGGTPEAWKAYIKTL